MAIQSLTRDQVLALLEQARHVSEQDFLMLLLAFHHGLRGSEVVSIVRDDIADGFLTVQRLKGSMRTTHPLVASNNPLLDERAAVFDYLLKMHRNQKLFPVSRWTFWRRTRRYAEAAGIPKHLRNVRVIKHSIAMILIGKIQLNELQQYLGHKSLSSTGAYLKVSDAEACAAVADALRI